MSIDDVALETHGASEVNDSVRLLTSAKLVVSRVPMDTSEGLVILPDEECRACEAAIETVANLLSISEGVRRRISSPTPCVALIPITIEDEEWLEDKKGFRFPESREMPAWFDPKLEALDHLEALADRLDGVALLAEAVAHSHYAGRFHEYMRLFELAFRLASSALIEPLAVFLERPLIGYTRDEVSDWILEVRHPLTHADVRSYFLTEADVRPVIHRVEQAAYDVLMNKRFWRDPRPDRRRVWSPDAVIGVDGPIVRQHSAPTMHYQILDDLCRYGRDMGAFVTDLPKGWWTGKSTDDTQTA